MFAARSYIALLFKPYFKAIPTVSSAVQNQDQKELAKALCDIAASLENAREYFRRMRGKYHWQYIFWAHSHVSGI